jgi:SAM-dependent methyltransferase
MSLSRMGAKVTGLENLDVAINEAIRINNELGLDARFVCCDLYSAKEYISEKFDIVFTTYGTIDWLPDMDKWAEVRSHFVKPNGQFVFVERHPTIWMFDDTFEQLMFSYFNKEVIVESSSGTYADSRCNHSARRDRLEPPFE